MQFRIADTFQSKRWTEKLAQPMAKSRITKLRIDGRTVRGWDVLANTIETLANACGGSAQCHKKYEYLSVSLETHGLPEAQVNALWALAELVEQVSDAEDHGDQSTVHWVRQTLASNKR